MNNTLWGSLIIEELIRLGVHHFCIAPGSRSTPLVAAIARHPKAQSHIFIDERSCAFFALGISKYSGIPAVMVTTSGSAMTHAYPAVIEAEAHNIPLLLLSADRPPELRNSGANQTIDQNQLFGQHVQFFVDLPCPSPQFSAQNLVSLIDHAVSRTQHGPVHINCMFRKPLDPEPTSLPELWSNDGPYSHVVIPTAKTDWRAPAHKRAVLIIGMLNNQTDQQHALEIAQHAQCPIFCDASSGLRLNNLSHALSPIDTIVQFDRDHPTLTPDLVIHLGGSFVSKQLPLWMKQQRCPIIQISPYHKRTQITATMQIVASIPNDIGTITHPLPIQELQRSIDERITQVCGSTLCEPSIIRTCTQHLPPQTSLFVSNSMPVRDLNRFGHTLHNWIRTGVNRGASGIDGIVATAAGWTHASQNPAVLLIGDLASLHDIGSLLQLSKRKIPLLVCIINNGGGGIFSFLPIAQEADIFEDYFATTHKTTIALITRAMGIPSFCIDTLPDFEQALSRFYTHPRFTVLELHTDRTENHSIHQNLNQAITQTLSTFASSI